MADIETLGILDEIQALVSDKLQVVSYKWLSRNFSVPSDTAKRLLQEFVEKNGSQLEVIYSLSGWLKNNPEAYHIKLVLGSKLSGAKEEFGNDCSVQVYSVQARVPKDPAVIWNAEFIQSEEFFKEPPNVVNCLRDNRFCGVSNSFVKRNIEGTLVNNTGGPQLKNAGIHGQSRTNFSNEVSDTSIGKEKKIEQSDPKPNQAINVQSGSVKEQVPQSKKKIQNDKISSGNSSSLASMWGRASAKPKPESASVKTDTDVPISNDAQVHANESVEGESSDDDGGEQMNFKRASNGEGNNRKRRVVFDYSDEDNVEDAVNLASPDPPKKQLALDSKKICSIENKNLDFDEQKEVKNKNDVNQEDKTSDAAVKNATKKRKVLKTRIDERGREVTEVVWEDDDEKETRTDDNTRKDKGENKTSENVVSRPVAAAPKKSPAVTSHATGKTGNKKTNAKDPKQGNIMSFFKKKIFWVERVYEMRLVGCTVGVWI